MQQNIKQYAHFTQQPTLGVGWYLLEEATKGERH
jgi:hypothetical protein